jgi:hypothetical protein
MDTRNGGVVSVTITAQGSGYVQGTATVTFGAAPAGGVTATGTPIVVAGAYHRRDHHQPRLRAT